MNYWIPLISIWPRVGMHVMPLDKEEYGLITKVTDEDEPTITVKWLTEPTTYSVLYPGKTDGIRVKVSAGDCLKTGEIWTDTVDRHSKGNVLVTKDQAVSAAKSGWTVIGFSDFLDISEDLVVIFR